MLQKIFHSRRCLHEREELEVAQSVVGTAELAYLVRRVADKTDWISSKIMMDLGCVEVLESTPGSIVPKAAMVPAETPPVRYL